MARTTHDVDGAKLEALIEQSEWGTIAAVARALARRRLKRAPSKHEAENSRRQIQKWIAGTAIGAHNARLLAATLKVDETEFFTRPADELPEGLQIMQEALDNQRQMRDDLALLAEQVSGLAADMTIVLQALGEQGGSRRSVGKQR